MAGKIVIMDSISHMDERNKGDIIVCGSHCGESAARHLLKFLPFAAIFNDAGKGKENAGIKGLSILNEAGIPAATVDAWSAKIGDGMETFKSGIISAVNQKAIACGIQVGDLAEDSAHKMLERIDS